MVKSMKPPKETPYQIARRMTEEDLARYGKVIVWKMGSWAAGQTPTIEREITTIEEWDADPRGGRFYKGGSGIDKKPTGEGEPDPLRKARHAEAVAYVASYTGTWGLPLDIRADTRWGTKWLRLSERQVDALLAGKQRDEERAERNQIDRELWQADQYAAWLQRPAAAVVEPVARPQAVTSDGMYRTPAGVVYKVQMAVNKSGHLYAKKLVVDEASKTASFEYEPGAIRRLTPDMAMTLEEAQAFGKLYGVCAVCGRTLTDERSIADGIGPICAGRAFGA